MAENLQSGDRSRPSRQILYAAGPGDVIGTYQHWHEQIEGPHEIVPTYSGQFFELCGMGAALSEIENGIKSSGLNGQDCTHGQWARTHLRQMDSCLACNLGPHS